MPAITADNHAPRFAAQLPLLGGQLVEPADVFIGKVSEDARHDILISYHDIMSIAELRRRPGRQRDQKRTEMPVLIAQGSSRVSPTPA